MQEGEHGHEDVRKSAGVTGYRPTQSVTRFEAAVTLFEMLTHIEAALAQPKRSKNEIKPGRKSNLAPNPSKAKLYSDVAPNHWASKSIAGLSMRSVPLVEGTSFKGEQLITGDELARWADGVAGWVEGRPPKVASVTELVRAGYLPQTASLAKKSAKPVTAQETTELLVGIITRSLEKITTVSADSRFAR